ncbi:MAG: hypothetical protein KF685_02425 [Acidobacteria bacterium]|nr:hypothetical protein [Acidobacteriota bacterium]
MRSIVFRDVRLQDWKPKGDFVLKVNFDTPIPWFYSLVNDVTVTHGADVMLKIMRHGYPDGIPRMSQLRGNLKSIELYACQVAKITPGSSGAAGDGNVFCDNMAQITQTTVKASASNQRYFTGERRGETLDFDMWEGTVLTYGLNGNVVNIEQ